MMDTDLVTLNYEAALLSLSIGLPAEDMIEMMEEHAFNDDLEIAQGYKLALEDYLSKENTFNCRVNPVIEE
tara:strand:+ start:831 stop:1043 length:213 start_codon:yes stop_codon:yes gene_type:complete